MAFNVHSVHGVEKLFFGKHSSGVCLTVYGTLEPWFIITVIAQCFKTKENEETLHGTVRLGLHPNSHRHIVRCDIMGTDLFPFFRLIMAATICETTS